jgi:hypothetical protein
MAGFLFLHQNVAINLKLERAGTVESFLVEFLRFQGFPLEKVLHVEIHEECKEDDGVEQQQTGHEGRERTTGAESSNIVNDA